MAQTARGTVKQFMDVQLEEDSAEVESAITSLLKDAPDWGQVYSNGTGSYQINQGWSDERTISALETLDLTGSLKDRFGNTITFDKIRELWVWNKSTTAGQQLQLDDNFVHKSLMTSGATQDIVVHPDSQVRFSSPIDGYTVAGLQDQIGVTPSTGSITYQIIILGVRA